MGTETKSTGATSNVGSVSRSTYETPEERAKKQVYIVRQSSLSVARDNLAVGAKSPPDAESIIALARKFEAYVFDTKLPSVTHNEIQMDEFPQEAE